MAYGLVAPLVLLPRRVLPRALQRQHQHDHQRPQATAGAAAFLRWAFASLPFTASFAFAVAGAERWVLGLGFFASAFLLVVAARALQNEAHAQDS